ncbi:hypothetical protein CW304_22795 [Bacillus sp. UFRGS-B20]|nr:hypothetical protein CW304_22795 [Bacillus sp. UFRGS-B20]
MQEDCGAIMEYLQEHFYYSNMEKFFVNTPHLLEKSRDEPFNYYEEQSGGFNGIYSFILLFVVVGHNRNSSSIEQEGLNLTKTKDIHNSSKRSSHYPFFAGSDNASSQ